MAGFSHVDFGPVGSDEIELPVFALDGEAVIGYEGAERPISAGECFHFAKGGLHSVKATRRFKMALLLTLE